jgi:hypothetical protein
MLLEIAPEVKAVASSGHSTDPDIYVLIPYRSKKRGIST